jgi:hypothetical protein
MHFQELKKMNYFTEVFLPSRKRVFKSFISRYPWVLDLRKLVFGDTMRFGVVFTHAGEEVGYTMEETRDAKITVSKGLNGIGFKVFKIPINLVMHLDEDFLKGWVEKEDLITGRPFLYLSYYSLMILPKLRLK